MDAIETHFAYLRETLEKLAVTGFDDSWLTLVNPELGASELRAWGSRFFAEAHASLMQVKAPWERAVAERDKILASKNAPQAKKDAAIALAEEHGELYAKEKLVYLKALAVENLVRSAPGVVGSFYAGDKHSLEFCLNHARSVDSWVWAYFNPAS